MYCTQKKKLFFIIIYIYRHDRRARRASERAILTTGVQRRTRWGESFILFFLGLGRLGARSEEEIDIASMPLGRRELLKGEVDESRALE